MKISVRSVAKSISTTSSRLLYLKTVKLLKLVNGDWEDLNKWQLKLNESSEKLM